MKFHQLLIVAAIFLTACSSPKYAYHFDHYDYNIGKKAEVIASTATKVNSPLSIDNKDLIASVETSPIPAANVQKAVDNEIVKSLSDKVKGMSKTERKEFRKELKKELKNLVKKDLKKTDNVDSVKRTKVFDTLSALAIAFGVGGIVLITLANISNAFWIVGAISLAIGAFFFVKWVGNGNG